MQIKNNNNMENDAEKVISLLAKASEEEKELIKRAYDFAKEAHKGQERLNGEPYFNHLFETAKNLAELGMDATTVVAGFLHDVLEDTETKAKTIEKEFGEEVLFIVEGVSKLGTLRYHESNRYSESLRKLLLATSKDIRVLIVKLCDRLHNMRTLSSLPPDKQKRIAAETLEIYAPIAYRLGIRKLSRELEDLSFPFVDKEGYDEISSLFKKDYNEKLEKLEKFRKSVMKELAKTGFVNFHSDHRVKGLYSLYKKYLKYKKDIEKIYDVLAMRLTVEKTEDCYRALGIIHNTWKPLPGRIKDYIAFPKLNGYQSLHTTIFTGDGDLVEIQIRTEKMHQEAEYGVASHALYKAGDKNKKQIAPWIESMLPHSVNEIKKDFLSERIFIFTPKGDVVDLPIGSSVIDFAYAIHSDLGNKMSGAKINGKFSSISTVLKGGEIVEIIINKNTHPTTKWLEYVKTSFAKKNIRSFTVST
jgi:GTP diphosphokinase / guanosine-3',5'-bis(diphosphate) 3'-diphosphatase